VLQSSVVKDVSSSPADVSLTLSAPSSAGTGSAITYTATIKNQGPNQAQGIAFDATLADSLIVNHVNPSAGTCGAGSEVVCNLGNLASGASATVTFNITPTTSGAIESTATVSSVSYDPKSSNNQATANTVVTGGLFSAVPTLSSISPNIAQAGSAGFMLTLSGTGFNPSSTVNLNGTSLTTTYVSSTQLTADVPPSLVANYGWDKVSVTNPAPGGGSSAPVALTIYQVLDLLANDILFDPFTRQVYASLPSASPTLAGNSVVALDPASGKLGTPVLVGSEPNVMAETSDGEYLYIGLSGANSLARFNLTTQSLEGTYPLALSSNPVAATWLSVMPGSDTSLAIDTSINGAVGIFDILGSSGAFRSNVTGTYQGNFPTFASPTEFYTYDDTTTGAEFYRWNVTASGPTLIDGTTLNGFGGFSGSFKLANGIVYGGNGGIIDPLTTPPSQLATLSLLNGYGNGVEPDPATGLEFMVSQNSAGQFTYTLIRYNTTQYVAEDFLPLPIPNSLVVLQMFRWGQDGLVLLAYNNNFGISPSTAQVILLRGPFVLPSELTSNPAPSISAVSPSSIAVNSGNTTLAVTGTYFVPGAVGLWGGQPRSTTFIDTGHLNIAIPASDLTSVKTVQLTTQNPGSVASNSLSISIH
jgi:trimeric autotransporter adhesin